MPDHSLTVNVEDGGLRLDRFITARLPDLSRARVRVLIEDGHVNGLQRTILEPDYRVKPAEVFHINIPEAEPAEPQPENIPLTILYEDDELIVIDKPAGLVVHPAPGHWTGTLVNALLAHCGDSLSGIGGVKRPGIVHRLDKDTSGVMVVAKTDKAHRALAAQFADHGREGALLRRYQALVWGAPSPWKGSVEANIGRHPTNRLKMAVLKNGGKYALTEYRGVKTLGDSIGKQATPTASLVECTLITGRTHQIRVHMTFIGHPVIGDELYGSGFSSKTRALSKERQSVILTQGRQALHAAVLGFQNPVTKEYMQFVSELPDDMRAIIEGLGSDNGT
ncbi:MAG: RluA family pseudouridine synthase, partial [Alphaproteobacteria bacterium]